MSNAQAEIQRLLPKRDKTGKNVALGVAGWFLLVPWFFMDFKNAEATEYEAYRQRYNHLASIAISKDCGVEPKEYPSIEEMKREYEKQKSQKQSSENDYEMDTALKLIGQTINDIIDGEDVDFAELREALIQHAGLAETGDLPAQLREDFTGEDRPAPANPATTGVTDPTQASAPTPGGAG